MTGHIPKEHRAHIHSALHIFGTVQAHILSLLLSVTKAHCDRKCPYRTSSIKCVLNLVLFATFHLVMLRAAVW